MKKKREPKRPNPHTLPPDFASRQKAELLRDHKVVIRFNDKEMEALKRYQAIAKGGKSRSAICREAIIEKVLSALDENQPTLF